MAEQKSGKQGASVSAEKMTKAQLLDSLSKHLTRDELASMVKAVNHGYRPYPYLSESNDGPFPMWEHPERGLGNVVIDNGTDQTVGPGEAPVLPAHVAASPDVPDVAAGE